MKRTPESTARKILHDASRSKTAVIGDENLALRRKIKELEERTDYSRFQDLYDCLRAALDAYEGVPVVAVVGVLAMLQQHIIQEAGDD